MSAQDNNLPLDGCVNLISSLIKDFVKTAHEGAEVPSQRIYKVASSPEPSGVSRSARMAALRSIAPTEIKKVAFDTRRVNQEVERIPRANLQYWNRSQQFLNDEAENRLKAIANLVPALEMIRDKYGHHPEYFQSYARSLLDQVRRAVKVGKEDVDVFKPQLDYLEQILFARYRLTLEDLEKNSKSFLYDKLIKRDEDLIKRDAYLRVTSDSHEENIKSSSVSFAKDGNGLNQSTQDSIVNAIFGNQDLRRDGEKKVERTITITIKDEVVE